VIPAESGLMYNCSRQFLHSFGDGAHRESLVEGARLRPDPKPMTKSPLAAPTEKYLYEFDAFRVDPVRRRLLRAGEQVPLTPKAFSILMVLLENRGEVVEKEELIRRVWADAFVTEANLTQNVSSLRKALGERANDHRFVVTVPGRGYSFVSEVLEVPREGTGDFPLAGSMLTPVPEAPPALSAVPPLPGDSGAFQLPPAAAPVSASVPPLPAVPRVQGRRRFLLAGLVIGFLAALIAAGLFIS
jgi:DNA-binding winged helix-turn-helix (wHTH) protein